MEPNTAEISELIHPHVLTRLSRPFLTFCSLCLFCLFQPTTCTYHTRVHTNLFPHISTRVHTNFSLVDLRMNRSVPKRHKGLDFPHPSHPLLLRLNPRLGIDSPFPLSLSSGGSAGRSDWERGGRYPCTGSSLGSVHGFGGLPCWSPTPTSSGDADRRPVSFPLRHLRWTTVVTGSRRSSSNKPACARLSPQAWDRVSPSRAHHGDEMARIWLDPCSGSLDPWWRAPQQPPLPPSSGRGGRVGSSRGWLPPLPGATLLLLLFTLLVGRGGEE
jgi:hypothetical protein